MASQHPEISDKLRDFISRQHVYFVATATADSRVNLSPKGIDSLRVLGPNRVVWLNLTGSGNESAAHVLADGRMTVMFCAFAGPPMILRLYGRARVVHRNDADWAELLAHFPEQRGVRQLFDLDVDLVQTSCGFGVPLMEFSADRTQLTDWADRKDDDGIRAYWEQKNQRSIDGLPTEILERSS
jgi:hypothetical protein